MSLTSRCATLTLALLLTSGVWARDPLHWGFEQPDQDWVASPLDPQTQKVARDPGRYSEGKASLAIVGKLPGSFGVTYYPWHDWTGFTQLSFDLYVPKDIPRDFDLWVYLKDKQYYWYQTAPFRSPQTGKPTGSLRPGQWHTVKLDVSSRSTIWKPGGHRRAWERTLYYPREFGIRVFSRSHWSGVIYLDNVNLTGNAQPLGRFDPGMLRPVAAPLTLRPSAQTVPVYGKFELSFNLDREYENPFDPRVVDVTGVFTAPDGTSVTIPGFLYQDYERSLTKDQWEQLIPVGHTFWKVRFAPTMPGTHRYHVVVKDATGIQRSAESTFTAIAPTDPRGYVRVSRDDPRYFEFDNGEFFFPTGINMRDGGDQAEQQKGTYEFDYFFRRFEEQGLNFVRTWMCAWWAGIEWSDKYHSRFDGVGRYNLYNAWRLDYALDLADKHNLLVELTLSSHGQFRRDKFDAEWQYNPYSVGNGGMIASPAMFFTSPTAKELVRQRLRYIVARWGYSRNLMSWDLVNEVDLTEGYDREQVAQWHREMAAYLKSIDPWKHLVCTHICLYWSYGDELWQLPEIEYIQADAYWKRRDIGMNECWEGKKQYRKPFLFIEYGPQTASLPISYEAWQQDFRVGMWVSNLMPAAAPAQFWYNREWEEHKLWRYQSGLIAFNRGEDRRGKNLKSLSATCRAANGIPLDVQAMGNGTSGAFYVYSFDNLAVPDPHNVPAERVIPSATVALPGFRNGTYTLEYWDTIAGQVVATTSCQVTNGLILAETPPFAADLACKIRPAD